MKNWGRKMIKCYCKKCRKYTEHQQGNCVICIQKEVNKLKKKIINEKHFKTL